jgi:cobalt-zinc-cadmium efflux system outer membrane protein
MDTASGRRHLRMKVADEALRAARLERTDAQRQLELQLKQQYIEAVLARDTLDFALEVQASQGKMLELNQIRYKAGAISETDVAKVETAKLEADQDVDRATQNLRAAKIAVAFLLGARGPIPDFKIEQDLPRFSIPAALAGASVDALLKEAIDHRPDLKAFEVEQRRAETAIAAARRQRVPDVALSAQFAGEGTGNQALQPPTLTFGVTTTLPLFYQFQGEMQKAEADLRSQQLGRVKAEARVASEVESAWAAFTGTQRRVERMEARLLDRARRARDLVQIQYQKGAASLLEYLDAQRTYIAVYVEYLGDLADYWAAVYQLEAAVGMELR